MRRKPSALLPPFFAASQRATFRSSLPMDWPSQPSLHRADLQRTNLQNAYLGARGARQIDLSYADFYRADLSGASLKGAQATGAVFYQARMTDAVLRNADLRRAIF